MMERPDDQYKSPPTESAKQQFFNANSKQWLAFLTSILGTHAIGFERPDADRTSQLKSISKKARLVETP
jgi:hypothetical protein